MDQILSSSKYRDIVLVCGIAAMQRKAGELGAKCGISHTSIRGESGIRYTTSLPINSDWSLSYDTEKTWENDPLVGCNFDGYAALKMAYSSRKKKPSSADSSITGYGEANDEGSSLIRVSDKERHSNKNTIEICAGFSGMESKEDLEIAQAGTSAMLEMILAIRKVPHRG